MKIYAVIDTNVIVSALLSRHHDSATVKILDYIYDRVIVPVYNNEIIEEYEAVLSRPKFNFSEETVYAVVEAIKEGGIDSKRIGSNEQLPDPKDIVFYEVALAAEDAQVKGMDQLKKDELWEKILSAGSSFIQASGAGDVLWSALRRG